MSTVESSAKGETTLRRALLTCGVLASVLYVGIDVLAAILYAEYQSFTSGMISELMASGAPTERLVDPLFLLYGVLMMAFGAGVWLSGREKRLRITASLLFAYAALGLLGPTVFEMNVRGSGGPPIADILHIAFTMLLVLFIFASVGFGASIRGRRFRVYSLATVLVMVVFGILSALAAGEIGGVQPTPWLGALERINIGAFLLWVMVLAVSLWRVEEAGDPSRRKSFERDMPPWALPMK